MLVIRFNYSDPVLYPARRTRQSDGSWIARYGACLFKE
jgi:hypothetical protein